jgi:hypothetical protein
LAAGVPGEQQPTFRLSRSEVLFEGRYALAPRGGLNYDLSADGQRFVMITEAEDDNAEAAPPHTTLIVIENWFEELKRLVPVAP